MTRLASSCTVIQVWETQWSWTCDSHFLSWSSLSGVKGNWNWGQLKKNVNKLQKKQCGHSRKTFLLVTFNLKNEGRMIPLIKTARRSHIRDIDHIDYIDLGSIRPPVLCPQVCSCSQVMFNPMMSYWEVTKTICSCLKPAGLAAVDHHVAANWALFGIRPRSVWRSTRTLQGLLLLLPLSPALRSSLPLSAPTATPPPSGSPGSVCTGGSQQRRPVFS